MQETGASEENSMCWSSSTNWIVTQGSLRDSISFDSSSSLVSDDDLATISRGVLILSPPSQDSVPCEITIHFRAKHEIHRVYLRSTARVYEIYYAPEQEHQSNEYLCTVRCGAAEEVTPTPCDTEAPTTECQKGDNGTIELTEQMAKSDSSNSDEDGWVEVKAPDSPLLDDRTNSKTVDGNTSTSIQICYEATAEISDASPCVSLTLRLLSLQTKGCVHVEEIYIYADPVESTNPDPPVNMEENLGRSSLLAMLVPSLLQISKPGTRRIQGRCFSDDAGVEKYQCGADKAADSSSPGMGRTILQGTFSSPVDQKAELVQEPTEIRPEKTQLGCVQQVMDPDKIEKNLSFGRIEKVLDDLVSRMGRIEAFCLRFEENMTKPLSCIEMRLQRLEQQLDAFTVRTQYSEPFPSGISAPEFLFDESDSEDKGCRTSQTVREETTFHDPSPPADDVPALLASQMCPGLVVKAPEFSNEDDEYTSCDETSEVKDCSETSEVKDSSEGKAALSIDSALASALAAFLSSATVKIPKLSQTSLDTPHEFSNGNNHMLDSSPVRVPYKSTDDPFSESDFENIGCNISDTVKKGTDFGDSLPVTGMAASVRSSQISPSPIIMAPEFPNKDDDYINCDDTLDSEVKDYHEGKASLSTDSASGFGRLAAFLSSTVVESPNSIPKLGGRHSNFLSSDDNEDLASSAVGIFCDGADKSGITYGGDKIQGNVDLDSTLNLLSPKDSLVLMEHDRSPRDSFPQKEHGIKWLEFCSKDAAFEGSYSNIPSPEVSLEQKEHDMEWYKCSSKKATVSTQNLLYCLDSRLSTNVNCNWHTAEWTVDSDSEDDTAGDTSLSQLDKGCSEASSSDSSFSETFMKNRFHFNWLDECSTDSVEGTFIPGQQNGHADNSKTTEVTAESVSQSCLTTGMDSHSAGYNHDKSIAELERALNSMLLDVKFAPEREWKTGIPLEVLLGEMPDTEVHTPDVKDDGAGTVTGCQDKFPLASVEQTAPTADQLLPELEDLTVATDSSSLVNDEPQDPGSSNQQLFSSLI